MVWLESLNEIAELVAAIGVVFEHVEGRGAGAEQDDIPGARGVACELHGALERTARVIHRQPSAPERLDAIGHLAHRHRGAAFLRDEFGEHRVFKALVLAAGDEHHRARLAKQRFLDGVGIRSLGVIHPLDAIQHADGFAAMGKRPVFAKRRAHRVECEATSKADTERGHQVLGIVSAAQFGVGHFQDGCAAKMDHALDEREVTVIDERAERQLSRTQLRQLVAEIHHRPIVRRLVFKDADFRRVVFLHRLVTIEMVVGEAEPDRDVRAESRDGLELE